MKIKFIKNHRKTAMLMANRTQFRAACLLALMALGVCGAASAEEWSDTAIGYRHGTKFAEPYDTKDITKDIFSLTHAGGYKYGTQFFNIDLLQSDANDPGTGTNSGAQEAYIVYRNTFDIGKISGKSLAFGPVRGVGVTAGFDWNTKNNAGYESKKRMLVLGPTLMMDVPGFLNFDLLLLNESNAPVGVSGRYTYKLHPALGAEWGIPVGTLGSIPVSFEGYGLYIAAKGNNEFGGATAPETNVDMELMFDVSSVVGAAPKTFRLGLEYQYWRNKFGNPSSVPGSLAKTPMVRAEYHF
jgi:nucleoside-specific outer membrane channel protein Tsx